MGDPGGGVIIPDMLSSTSAPVHVLPDRRGRWSVRHEGEDQPLSEHGSATEAEIAARALGRDVVVHDRYGRIRHVPAPRRHDTT
jgi:hypothetical protein